MEALTDTGSDPLLSAAISNPHHHNLLSMDDDVDSCVDVESPSSRQEEDHFIDFADDLVGGPRKEKEMSAAARQLYGNYATLTNLQPLPPISTVTSKESRYSRESPSPDTRSLNYYFPTSSNASYDLKYEEDEEDSGVTHSSSSPSDYGGTDIHHPFASAAAFESFDIKSPMVPEKAHQYISSVSEADSVSYMEHMEELSQGTLSDLLRNPKPWSKLKSGRETFRRMAKWLQEPEFQRMSALRLAACKRKEELTTTSAQPVAPKKTRLVFTDIQRRTLQAIFRETKRPSRDMQITISQQLNLDPTTVANFFMNARRRGHDMKEEVEEAAGDQELDGGYSDVPDAVEYEEVIGEHFSLSSASSTSSSSPPETYICDINTINLLEEPPVREEKLDVKLHANELDFPSNLLEP